MSKWYFYQSQNQAHGPFDQNEIESLIRSGQIKAFDLTFRDGDEKWVPAFQLNEFKNYFKDHNATVKPEQWVILFKKKTNDGPSQFLQAGPYSTDEVKSRIQSGEIDYRDFIWREGQGQWQRIADLATFNPNPVPWKPTYQLPQDVELDEATPSSEILKGVVAAELPQEKVESPLPENVGEDLTLARTNPSVVRRTPKSAVQPTTKVPLKRPLAVPDVGVPASASFRTLRWASGALAVVVIGFLILYREEILRYGGISLKKQEAKTAIKKESPKVVPEVRVEAPAPSVVAPVQVPRVRPTRLALKFLASDGPRLKIDTDASSHFQFEVVLTGDAGRVLGQVSVYRKLVSKYVDGQGHFVDLRGLNLGDGIYEARGVFEQISDRLSFRMGANNSEFRNRLKVHKKLISLPFQRERRRLILANSDLIRVMSRISSRRSPDEIKAWRRRHLSEVNLKSPRSLVFAEAWLELDQVVEALEASRDGSGESLRRVQAMLKRSQDLALF